MKFDLSTISAFVQLAQQYGPFLFAILFIFIVTRTAHKYYRECNTRVQPPASEAEKAAYRWYFIVSVWTGLAVMLLSIFWWFYSQLKGTNVYQVAIVGLAPGESILSQYYVKDVPRPTMPGVPPIHDYFFVVAQSNPFKVGDKFDFYYFKIPAPPTAIATAGTATPPVGAPQAIGITGQQLEIKYAGNQLDTFEISNDGGAANLKLVASNVWAPDSLLAFADIKSFGGSIALSGKDER